MTTNFTLPLAAFVAFSGCTPTDSIEDEVGEIEEAIYDPSNPPTPVATDGCDDPTYAGATWSSQSSAHVVAYYIPGTAAESDIAAILAAREAAYADITSELGISTAPTISLYLSPNRLAASANGRGFGTAFPGQDRYEVVYTGRPDSFEVQRPGSLLARTLEYHVDTANPKRIPILSVGLAELLDQSGRNLHDAYAQNLLAGTETRVRVASLESNDVTGKNAGRAGSLVKFLVDRYGMSTFLDIFKATAVAPVGTCALKSSTYGCINSAATLTNMLDGVLTAKTGESWSTVAAAWKAEVNAHIATVKLNLSLADRNEIKNLVDLMDQAIITDSADLYRSTMEGFYCDWGGESARADIAVRTVEAFESTSSTVMRIYPTGTSNFTTVRVAVRRVDERGFVTPLFYTAEKLPQGWRFTWGPDWW
jgi:hypothetical protein